MKLKNLIFLFLLICITRVASAANGDGFYYGNGRYTILSETELTVAFNGFRNSNDTFFYPTVEKDGKSYSVTEIQKLSGTTYYFNCDFTNYPPTSYKVKVIGDYVFQNTSVDPNKLPSSVEHLGGYNFTRRSDIKTLTLPSSLKSIGSSCFAYCGNLQEVNLNWALESIGSSCFFLCQKLTTVNFNYSLKEIGSDAFVGCTSLTSADIKSAEIIGAGSFQDCPKMTSLTLPSNLQRINSSAFLYCTSLPRIVIPKNVKYIGKRAFEHVDKLEALIFTPLQEPSYVDWDDTPVDFSSCLDDHAASVMWVPSRKSYEHGTEMISFEDKEMTYSGVSPEVSWTNNTPWAVSMVTSNLPANAGQHAETVTAKFQSLNNLSLEIPVYYTINKAPLKLFVNDFTREYGLFTNNLTCSYDGFVNNESASSLRLSPKYIFDVAYNTPVGQYPISASLSTNNYEVEVVPGSYIITKAPLSVKVNDTSRYYGDPNPSFSCKYEGLKSWDSTVSLIDPIIYTTEASESSSVGNYSVSASGGSCQNYEFTSYTPGIISINKAQVTVSTNNAERVYGECDPDFHVSYSGLKNGEEDIVLTKDFIFTTNTNIRSDVGNYLITASGGEAENYSFKYNNIGTFKITPANISVKVLDVTREYGEFNPEWTFAYDGLKNDETAPEFIYAPSVFTTGGRDANVGTYEITVSGGSIKNYNISEYIPGTLTVTKAPLILRANNCSKAYGESNPSFGIDFVGIKSVDETVGGPNISFISPYSVSCNATNRSACGEYSIVVSGGEASNYDITDRLSGILNITKIELCAKAKDASRVFGNENPVFELEFSGFVNGENKDVLTELPGISTEANMNSMPGTYAINVSGGVSHNYIFRYVSGELTIVPRVLEFAASQYSFDYDGSNHIPEYICDGPITDEEFLSHLKITKKTYYPQLSGYLYDEVESICDAGQYKIQLYNSTETLNAFSFADVTVNLAESELHITNADELAELNVGDQKYIEWESNAPHTQLRVYVGTTAPVDVSSETVNENGIDVVRYKLCALNEGDGHLILCADGSPNHLSAKADIYISISNNAGIDDATMDILAIISHSLRAEIIGKHDSDMVRVFNTNGLLVYCGTDNTFEVGCHGVYIVHINGKSYKIKL